MKSKTRAQERRVLRWAASLSPSELIVTSKKGLRGQELISIQKESHFSNEEWSRYLQVTPRTIQRYQKSKSVDPVSSERALLMAQIVERGFEVFGSEEKFKMWFYSPSFALGDIAPTDLLDTTTGMNMVMAELGRIDYGVY